MTSKTVQVWDVSIRVWGITLLLLAATTSIVNAGDETCHPIPITTNSPSGIAGCTLDGPTAGVASWYSGTVAAANWCVYPWKNCQAVSITSQRTGRTIYVTPGSFCDCYWPTSNRRLIDLIPSQVLALGESLSSGLYAVTVTPVEQQIGVPNTSMGSVMDDHALTTIIGWLMLCLAALVLIDYLWFRGGRGKK